MNHEQFSSLIDSYLQGQLTADQREAMDAHQASCNDCALLLRIREDGRQLDDLSALPASFSSAWRQAIQEEEEASTMEQEQSPRPSRQPFRFRRWMAVAAALLLVVGGTALSRNSLNRQRAASSDNAAYEATAVYGGYAPGAAPMAESAVMMDKAADASLQAREAGPQAVSKIIRTVSISLDTRAFEEDLKKLNEAIAQQGGYVEYSDVSVASGSRRYATLTARVPKDKLDSFLAQIQSYGRLSNMTQSQEDVSENYRDVDTRLKTQTAKMARLQELLAKASTVADMLSIESEIANTQYQIDSLTGSLRGMDSKVDYSSVRIELREQTQPSVPEKMNLWERIKIAVSDAWQQAQDWLADGLIFLAVILPYLAALTLLIIIIRLLVKRRKT